MILQSIHHDPSILLIMLLLLISSILPIRPTCRIYVCLFHMVFYLYQYSIYLILQYWSYTIIIDLPVCALLLAWQKVSYRHGCHGDGRRTPRVLYGFRVILFDAIILKWFKMDIPDIPNVWDSNFMSRSATIGALLDPLPCEHVVM